MKRSEIFMSLIGLIMILTGAYFIVRNSVTEGTVTVPGKMLSDIILMIGGACIIPFFRKNIKYGTAFSLLVIGAATIIGRIWYLTDSMDGVEIGLAIIYIIASIVMVYYSLSLFFDASAGSLKGIICLGVLVILELAPTFYYIYMGRDPIEVMTKYMDDLVCGAMHMSVLIILTRKDILLENFTKRLMKNSKGLYNIMITPPGTYLDVRDVKAIQGDAEQGWTEYDEGPIERELSLDLRGAEFGIRLQRWRGEDETILAVCLNDVASYTVALSFPIESTVVDLDADTGKGNIRFYGREGMFVDIEVRDSDEEKKGYIETVKVLKRRLSEKYAKGQDGKGSDQ